MTVTSAQRISLLNAARWAPSADNRPFCSLAWVGETLEIQDSGEFTSTESHRRVLANLALGAMATNLTVRAQILGLQPTAQWLTAARPGDVVGRVSFLKNHDPPNLTLNDVISTRCSNRRLDFRGPPADLLDLERMYRDVAAIGGAQLHWFDSEPARRNVLRLLRYAEIERFRNKRLHQELFLSIRFDVGWSTSTQVGIPAGALGLPWIERMGFPMLRHWWLQRLVNVFGAHIAMGWRAADLPCRLSPHVGAITVNAADPRAAIHAGQALQLVWLRSASLGMAFQVFAASPLYAMTGPHYVPAALQAMLRQGWNELCGDQLPYVVFRMGHARQPVIRASRPASI